MTEANWPMDMMYRCLALHKPQKTAGAPKVSTAVDVNTGQAIVEARLACAPERVFALLTDFPNLTEHIFCLHKVEVLRSYATNASVRYTMKLPFPLGRVQWTNLVSTKHLEGGSYSMEWVLVDGDLAECSGKILLERRGEFGEETHATYQISVEHKSRLPKRAQQIATRWLLPRVINRLCKKLESHGNR